MGSSMPFLPSSMNAIEYVGWLIIVGGVLFFTMFLLVG